MHASLQVTLACPSIGVGPETMPWHAVCVITPSQIAIITSLLVTHLSRRGTYITLLDHSFMVTSFPADKAIFQKAMFPHKQRMMKEQEV